MDRFTFYSVYNEVFSPNYKGFDPDKGKKKKKEEKKEVKKENKEFDYDTEGVLRLRDAIVEQCAEDYRSALRARNREKEIELREWFLGDDFIILSASSNIDGARTVRDLRTFYKEFLEDEKDRLREKIKKLNKKKEKKQDEIKSCQNKIKKADRTIRFIRTLEDEPL